MHNIKVTNLNNFHEILKTLPDGEVMLEICHQQIERQSMLLLSLFFIQLPPQVKGLHLSVSEDGWRNIDNYVQILHAVPRTVTTIDMSESY